MKNYLVIGTVAVVIIGAVVVLGNKKGGTTSPTTSTETNKTSDLFKDITDLCNVITKEQISQIIGKPIIKTESRSSGTLHSCQYYLTDTQMLGFRYDILNIENQKKGQEMLGRKIITNPAIPMEHFIVVNEDGVINEIYLIIKENEYLSFDRSSTKTLSEEETINLATKIAGLITGNAPLSQSSATNTPVPAVKNDDVPLPQDTDIIRSFLSAIEIKKHTDAVSYMTVTNDSEKQAWTVQFNAMTSMKLLDIEPSMQEEWTDTKHTFKVTMDVQMNPDSANAPIPYYGWDNGKNIRWLTMEKVGKMWKVQSIATGP